MKEKDKAYKIIVEGKQVTTKKVSEPLDFDKVKYGTCMLSPGTTGLIGNIWKWLRDHIKLSITPEPEFIVIHTFDIPGDHTFHLNVGLKIKVFVYVRSLGFSILFI